MGGTKTEMERLLADAQKLTGIKYDIKNLGDVYEAIHVIQEELKITGTTAAEAEKTLTGSIAATKAAWQNFLSGSGNLGQVVESASVALDNIIRIVDEAVPTIADEISAHLPQLVELGFKLVGSIGEGILKNMPKLMSTMGEIVKTLAKTLEENGPQMLSQGVEYMINFINGLSSNMPQIMATVTRIIMGLVTAITDHLPDIVQAAINLAVGIGLGLIQAIPEIIEKLPEIIGALVSALIAEIPQIVVASIQLGIGIGQGLVEAVPEILVACGRVVTQINRRLGDAFMGVIHNAKTWGHDLLTGFANGITERLGVLRDHVMNVVNTIKSYLHFSRPDVGPLREYEKWMPDMIKGMADSLDKASPMLLGKISSLANAMSMSPTLNGTVNSQSPNVNVIVNNSYEQDPLGQMVNTIKTFSNGAKNDYNYGYGG